MRSVKTTILVAGLVAGGLFSGGALPLLGSLTAASATTVKSCVPSQITVTHSAAQGTAGTIYIPLVFTNTGSSCALWGVPTIQPVAGRAHRAVGPLARNLSMGEMPARQVLAKGHAVSVAFGVVETGNFTPSTCVARSADGVVVTLGSFVRSTYVHLPIKVCTKRASTTTKLVVPGVNGY